MRGAEGVAGADGVGDVGLGGGDVDPHALAEPHRPVPAAGDHDGLGPEPQQAFDHLADGLTGVQRLEVLVGSLHQVRERHHVLDRAHHVRSGPRSRPAGR